MLTPSTVHTTIRALTSLNVSSNSIKGAEAGNALGNALAANTVLKQLDLSKNDSGAEFANEFAVGLGANGAMVSIDMLDNSISAGQAHNLVAILNEHPTLKSLCGNKGNERQLDMSNKKMGVNGAIMLAPEIVANGALTSLNLAKNHLYATGAKHIAEAIKVHVSALRFD